jgi:hypothetical protein
MANEFSSDPHSIHIKQKPNEKVSFDPTSPSVNPNLTKPSQTYQVKL